MRLVATDWHMNTTHGRNPTYREFLELLTAVRSIQIRAKYTNVCGNVTSQAIITICNVLLVLSFET